MDQTSKDLVARKIKTVEELRGTRSAHVDLAEGGGIEQADALARRLHLALGRRMQALAWFRIGLGAAPLSDRLEQRDGEWRIAERVQAYSWREGNSGVIIR